MKVLIDHGVHPDVIDPIKQNHNTELVQNQLGGSIEDPEVMEYARHNDRVMITDDKSFVRMTKSGDTDPPDVTQSQSGDMIVSHGKGRRAVLRTIEENNGAHKVVGIGKDSHNGVILFSQDRIKADPGIDPEGMGNAITFYLDDYPNQHIKQTVRWMMPP